MNKIFTNFVGGGTNYKTPALLVEAISPEAGYCNSAIGGNNESINDAKQYDFEF